MPRRRYSPLPRPLRPDQPRSQISISTTSISRPCARQPIRTRCWEFAGVRGGAATIVPGTTVRLPDLAGRHKISLCCFLPAKPTTSSRVSRTNSSPMSATRNPCRWRRRANPMQRPRIVRKLCWSRMRRRSHQRGGWSLRQVISNSSRPSCACWRRRSPPASCPGIARRAWYAAAKCLIRCIVRPVTFASSRLASPPLMPLPARNTPSCIPTCCCTGWATVRHDRITVRRAWPMMCSRARPGAMNSGPLLCGG